MPPAISSIATYINESVNAVNPAYVTLAVGIIIYWLAGEPWSGMSRELFTMGLKNFFQTAKQDAINQLVDERADELATERIAEARTEIRAQAHAEARTETRTALLQELRKMTPDEIAAMLDREVPPANSNGATPKG